MYHPPSYHTCNSLISSENNTERRPVQADGPGRVPNGQWKIVQEDARHAVPHILPLSDSQLPGLLRPGGAQSAATSHQAPRPRHLLPPVSPVEDVYVAINSPRNHMCTIYRKPCKQSQCFIYIYIRGLPIAIIIQSASFQLTRNHLTSYRFRCRQVQL